MKLINIFGALTLLSSFVVAHAGDDAYFHHNGTMGGFGFMDFFRWAFMLLIFIALILFIMWLIKQLQGNNLSRRR